VLDFAEDVGRARSAHRPEGRARRGAFEGRLRGRPRRAREPGAFAKLLLIDPVIMARERYGIPGMTEHFGFEAAQRLASAEEMFERFEDRPPFNAWNPAVLMDLLPLRPVAEPDRPRLVLACPPRSKPASLPWAARGTDRTRTSETLTIPFASCARASPANAPATGTRRWT